MIIAFKPWLSITLDQDILLIAHSAFFMSFSPSMSIASLSCSAPGFSPEHRHLTQPEPSRAGELMPPRATQLQDGESVTEKSKHSVMWWENSEVHATQFTRGSQDWVMLSGRTARFNDIPFIVLLTSSPFLLLYSGLLGLPPKMNGLFWGEPS